MVILEIIQSLRNKGGAEVFFCSLVQELSKGAADEIHVVTLWDGINESFSFIQSLPNVFVHSLGKRKHIDFAASRKLHRLLVEIRPDVIHSHLSILLTYVLGSGLRRQTWKIVHTIHNIVDKESDLLTNWFRHILSREKMITLVPISDVIASQVKNNKYLRKIPSVTIYNGATLRRPKPTDNRKKYSFVCVAGMRPQKRLDLLLDAFEMCFARHKNATLVLVGDGALRGQLEEQVSKLSCASNVFFAGAQNDVYPFLLASKVFVLSSSYEGNPISILEALDCGLPIIAPNIGGIPDVVVPGENGWLFEVGDCDELARLLSLTLEQEQSRFLEAIGENNREKAQCYSMEMCAEEYRDLFVKVTAKDSK